MQQQLAHATSVRARYRVSLLSMARTLERSGLCRATSATRCLFVVTLCSAACRSAGSRLYMTSRPSVAPATCREPLQVLEQGQQKPRSTVDA